MTVLVMRSRLLPLCSWTGVKQSGICKDLAADSAHILLQHEAAQIHGAVCMGTTSTHSNVCGYNSLI